MQIMTYTEVRSNLKSVCDKVVDDCDSVIIHRRDGDNVVLMSESEFNSWKEAMKVTFANRVNLVGNSSMVINSNLVGNSSMVINGNI